MDGCLQSLDFDVSQEEGNCKKTAYTLALNIDSVML